jgi:hypothetical protein
MYVIQPYSKLRLDELNKKLNTNAISIKPSKNKTKKIDIFINNKKIASVGAINMKDFPTHIKESGLEFANKRRTAFYNRFNKIPNIKNGKISNMFWSRYFLW